MPSIPRAVSNACPYLPENCPTCGSPGLVNLNYDAQKALDILRSEHPLVEYDNS